MLHGQVAGMLVNPVEFFAKVTEGAQERLPGLTPRQGSGEPLETREGTQFEVPIWHLKLGELEGSGQGGVCRLRITGVSLPHGQW